jgi:integrase
MANEDARAALERWIAIRGGEPGPLFNPVNKGGRIERRKLSEQAIYIACQKRASEAGLPPTSPEDLRRANPTRADLTRRAAHTDNTDITDNTNADKGEVSPSTASQQSTDGAFGQSTML